MRNPRMLFVLVIAVGCGLGAALLVAQYMGNKPEAPKAKIWRVKKEKTVTAYSQLKKDDFDAKDMDQKDAEGFVVADEGFDDLVKQKKVLKVSLGESQPLLYSNIYDPEKDNLRGKLKPGEIAVTIPVTNISGVAGFVQPGHRVDIQSTTTLNTGDGGKPYTQLVLQNIEVLATNSDTSPSQDAPAKPTSMVTLRLTRDQANLLGSYQQGGAALSLLLRAVNDKEIYTTPGKLQQGGSREIVSTNAPDDWLVPTAQGVAITPPPIVSPSVTPEPPKNTDTKPDNKIADTKTDNKQPEVGPIETTQPRVAAAPKNDKFTMTVIDDPNKAVRTYDFKTSPEEKPGPKGGLKIQQ